MIEQVKMLMDEQSREALQRVRADFEEILRPLNLLNDLRQRLDSLAESQEESANAVQKKVRDIEDALVESKQAVDGVTEGGRLLAMRLSEVGNDLSYVKSDMSGVKEACFSMKKMMEVISEKYEKDVEKIESMTTAVSVLQARCLKVAHAILILLLVLAGLVGLKLFC